MDRRSFVMALFGGALATAAGTYCSVANAAAIHAAAATGTSRASRRRSRRTLSTGVDSASPRALTP